MCHGDDSRPPAPPVQGRVASHADLHLTSADGTRFMAYAARPESPTGAGVVILPDFRGLHAFYKALADRLAEAGFSAVAIDYFGRSLGDGPRGEGVETMPLLMQLSPEMVAADARAGVEHLLSGEAGEVRSVFALGFCYGGSQAWNQSAFDHRLAGAIGFYGRPADCGAYVSRMRVPLLVLAAGEDFLTPQEEARRFDEELTSAGVEHRFVLYDGAPHSFFDGGSGEHEEACADAWREVLGFISKHTADAGAVSS